MIRCGGDLQGKRWNNSITLAQSLKLPSLSLARPDLTSHLPTLMHTAWCVSHGVTVVGHTLCHKINRVLARQTTRKTQTVVFDGTLSWKSKALFPQQDTSTSSQCCDRHGDEEGESTFTYLALPGPCLLQKLNLRRLQPTLGGGDNWAKMI